MIQLSAAVIALPSAEATLTVPSSLMSILAPVFSTISRMTLPPEPMTSRILSVGMCDDLDARRVFAELGAGLGKRLRHLAEDVQAAVLGLGEGDPHDLLGDALDLDVHLERGDAVLRAGDLEVHVAEMILVAEDVGEDGEAVVLLDQAHGDARHRLLERNAGVHQRQRGAADRRHRGRAVRLGDLGDDAERVGEVMVRRQHRTERRARRACRGRSRGGRGTPCGRSRPPNRAGNCSGAGRFPCRSPPARRRTARRRRCRASRRTAPASRRG